MYLRCYIKEKYNLNTPLVWNQNYFVNNYETCNYYYTKGIKYGVISNEITKEERKKLVKILKNFELNINGFRKIEEAIITKGGINVKEINPRTMESKIIKGLYFAGEIIDLDAFTGGFNLQIAWSTGYVAGLNQ